MKSRWSIEKIRRWKRGDGRERRRRGGRVMIVEEDFLGLEIVKKEVLKPIAIS